MRLIINLIKTVTAATTLFVITVGPPWALLHFIGNPYPAEGVSLSAPLSDDAIIGLFAAMVWLLWVQVMACIAAEVLAVVTRDRIHPRVPLALPAQQHLVRSLVGAALVAIVVAPTLGSPAFAANAGATPHPYRNVTAPTAPPVTQLHTAKTVVTPQVPGPAGDSANPDPDGRERTTYPPSPPLDTTANASRDTVTVMRLDSLWSIAERVLGDGEAWDQIAALNEGHTMNDGTVFTAAGPIRPGWHLRVPGQARRDVNSPARTDTSRTEPPAPARTSRTSSHPTGDTAAMVTVLPGDTLSQIAEDDLGDADLWPHLYRANRPVIGADPDLIYPGQTLDLTQVQTPTNPLPHESEPRHEDHGGDRTPGHPLPEHHAQVPGLAAPTWPPGLAGLLAGHPGHLPLAPTPAPTNGPTTEPTSAPSIGSSDAASAQSQPAGPITTSRPEEDRDGRPGQTTISDRVVNDTALRGLLSAAACLAAGLLALLVANRRRQLRHRRIGRLAPPTPTELAGVERVVADQGSQAADVVDWLHQALRQVAAWCHTREAEVPDLTFAVLSADELTLHFDRPSTTSIPPGWTSQEDHRAWTLPRRTPTQDVEGDHAAPYPALVSVGRDPDGRTWLLDLESVGDCSIGGDPETVRGLMRFLVAELAVNPWSAGAVVQLMTPPSVDLAPEVDSASGELRRPLAHDDPTSTPPVNQVASTHGTPGSQGHARLSGELRELVGLNPGRLHEVEVRDGLTQAKAKHKEAAQVETTLGMDVLTRRRDGVVLDSASPVIVVVPGPLDGKEAWVNDIGRGARSRVIVVHQPAQPVETGDDNTTVSDSAGSSHEGAPVIEALADGRVRISRWETTLDAFTLGESEASAMAALLTVSRDVNDAPMPPLLVKGNPLDGYATADGSIRTELIEARQPGSANPSSLLPGPDEEYLTRAATTSADLAAAAPRVPESTRAETRAIDLGLDQDLADWADPTCPRPKVRLLGAVNITSTAGGDPSTLSNLAGTISFIAFLACQDRGVSKERAAEAFGWKTTRTVENRATDARYLLGARPDGTPWLPEAGATEGARRGAPTYELDLGPGGVLVDFDLFRRLHFRALRQGTDGGEQDLLAALALIVGAPFEAATDRRFPWLAKGQPHAEIMDSAIAKVAHLVATRALADGRTDVVRLACEAVHRANPYADVAWLDLAAAAEADADNAAADALVRTHVVDAYDEDLPERTEAVLDQRDWATG